MTSLTTGALRVPLRRKVLGWRERQHLQRAEGHRVFSERFPRPAPVLAEQNLEVEFLALCRGLATAA